MTVYALCKRNVQRVYTLHDVLHKYGRYRLFVSLTDAYLDVTEDEKTQDPPEVVQLDAFGHMVDIL